MEQKKPNQERGKKRLRGKTKAIIDSQPSKAPGQDQEVKELLGSTDANRAATAADSGSGKQGISNRPAREEHAFPEPGAPAAEPSATPAESDATVPQQQGGNRGGV
jgi:hypothetical protein